ncbi:MAG: 50S ribosomal protein L13 [Dehalococcoidia bacterium]|nr:MAG: 50S ribosomal protein L13 [Dehalococcoidia bacterium]
MKTYSPKAKDIQREWWVIDATNQTLGRMASQLARLLMGKHKAIFAPHIDTGDYVVVINAARVRVTGKKAEKKSYYRHSGYPGGLKSQSFEELFSKNPVRVIELAVKGMLPRNRLGRAMFKKLKVYPGDEHPHQGQVRVRRTERSEELIAMAENKGSEILPEGR